MVRFKFIFSLSCVVSMWVIFVTVGAYAKPFIPESADSILESVPVQKEADFSEIKKLQDDLKQDPGNLEQTLELFGKYMKLASRDGDPYYSGKAEALIAPWLQKKEIPEAVLVARATVRQYNHDFIGAENDLSRVLTDNQKNIQARLLRSNIYRIQGRYEEAQRDCRSLAFLTDPVVVSVCQLSISTMTGKAGWASERLQELIEKKDTVVSKEIREWFYVVLSEALSSVGKNEAALRYLQKQAGETRQAGVYLQSAYMDLMLQTGRYKEAYDFLSEPNLPDALLLRKAIAAKKLKRSEADGLMVLLAARFTDSGKAGRAGHYREKALYNLYLRKDAAAAIGLALLNWREQKELIDTRIVLEAAIQSRQYKEANSVIAWIEKAGTEDMTIRGLIKEIREQGQ